MDKQETGSPALTEAETLIASNFDIGSIEDVQSAEVQLRRNGNPIPVYVTLAGPEHPTRKAFAFAKQRKMRQQLAKTGKMEFTDPAEDEAEEVDLLASCVLAWRTENTADTILLEGKLRPCTRGNVTALLSDTKRAWFRRAVRAAFDDNEAFIKTSANG